MQEEDDESEKEGERKARKRTRKRRKRKRRWKSKRKIIRNENEVKDGWMEQTEEDENEKESGRILER